MLHVVLQVADDSKTVCPMCNLRRNKVSKTACPRHALCAHEGRRKFQNGMSKISFVFGLMRNGIPKGMSKTCLALILKEKLHNRMFNERAAATLEQSKSPDWHVQDKLCAHSEAEENKHNRMSKTIFWFGLQGTECKVESRQRRKKSKTACPRQSLGLA